MKLIRNAEDAFFDGVIVPLGTDRVRKGQGDDPASGHVPTTYWTQVAIKASDVAGIPCNADEVVAIIRLRRMGSPLLSDPRLEAAVIELLRALHERQSAADQSDVPESTYALI